MEKDKAEFDSTFTVEELQAWLLANGFTEDTARSCKDEDMDGETIQSLVQSGSMEQFKCCGFTKVRDQLKLRKLLTGDHEPSPSSKSVASMANNITIQVSSNGKLSLAEMKKLTPEEKSVYLIKRNKVADAADQAWPHEIPKFKNSDKNKEKLEKLVTRITPECSLPFFKARGIKQHILDHFNEKRRYRETLKRGNSSGSESPLVKKKRKKRTSTEVNVNPRRIQEGSIDTEDDDDRQLSSKTTSQGNKLKTMCTSEGNKMSEGNGVINPTSVNPDQKDCTVDDSKGLIISKSVNHEQSSFSSDIDEDEAIASDSTSEKDSEDMPLKTAEIIVTCAFEELFIKSIGKQQIAAAAKSLLTKEENRQLKGGEKAKYLPPLAKAFLDRGIVKIKKGLDPYSCIARGDVAKMKTF